MPDCRAIFKLWADICVICCLFDFVLFLVLIFLLINLKEFLTFAVMLFMCFVQLRSFLIVTPRYFAASVVLGTVEWRV